MNMLSFFVVINFIYVLPPNRTRSLISSEILVVTYLQDLQRAIFQKAEGSKYLHSDVLGHIKFYISLRTYLG